MARPRLEAWIWLAFASGLATIALFVFLGLRPGGAPALFAWRYGRLALFLAGAVLLLFALAWSLYRRPVLQRGRLAGWLTLAGVVWLSSYPLAYPSPHEDHPSRVPFVLPVRGEWTVRWGGNTGAVSALVILPDRRFGFDLVVTDESGRSHRDVGGEREWLCVGREVLAPAPGRVERVLEDPGYGHALVLLVAPGEYLFLGSLEPGSISVSAGAEVRTGQMLGLVGGSARSALTPEPHLLIHLQDTPEPGAGEGIPFSFHGYIVGGAVEREGVPTGGVGPGGVHVGQRIRAEG